MKARPRTHGPPGTRLRLRLLALAAALLSGPAAARAHLAYGAEGLRELAARCDLAVVVEFEGPRRQGRAGDGSQSHEVFPVKVLSTLFGVAPSPHLEITSHAEGSPGFAAGERALLFLEHLASPLERAGSFSLASLQDPRQEWRLGPHGDELVAVVREYLALRGAQGSEGTARFRAILLRELRAADPRLREDALREWIRLGRAPLLQDPGEMAPFAALVPALPVAEGIVLAGLLERQGGFEPAPHLLALTGQPLAPGERAALTRAAGRSRDPRLSRWLAGELGDPDPLVRRDAAAALGEPWHGQQVPALAAATGDPDERVVRAALRALAQIGSEPARAVLQDAAASGVEPIRRFAAAELRRASLEGGLPPPAPGTR